MAHCSPKGSYKRAVDFVRTVVKYERSSPTMHGVTGSRRSAATLGWITELLTASKVTPREHLAKTTVT